MTQTVDLVPKPITMVTDFIIAFSKILGIKFKFQAIHHFSYCKLLASAYCARLYMSLRD